MIRPLKEDSPHKLATSPFALGDISPSILALANAVTTSVGTFEDVEGAVRAGLGVVSLGVESSFSTDVACACKVR